MDIFNILINAIKEDESLDYLLAVLDELINCTVWHFSHEERLMLKYSYEDINEHKRMHSELINSANTLKHKISQSNESISDEDVIFLEHWLTEHILTDDMRLGVFLSHVM